MHPSLGVWARPTGVVPRARCGDNISQLAWELLKIPPGGAGGNGWEKEVWTTSLLVPDYKKKIEGWKDG